VKVMRKNDDDKPANRSESVMQRSYSVQQYTVRRWRTNQQKAPTEPTQQLAGCWDSLLTEPTIPAEKKHDSNRLKHWINLPEHSSQILALRAHMHNSGVLNGRTAIWLNPTLHPPHSPTIITRAMW